MNLRAGLSFFMLICAFSWALAVDMPAGTEQFYVVQGVFADLDIVREACGVEDEVVNFACGSYPEGLGNFQLELDTYIGETLPGLYLSRDWFRSGENTVRHYQSVVGSYLFVYSPNGAVTIAFTPR